MHFRTSGQLLQLRNGGIERQPSCMRNTILQTPGSQEVWNALHTARWLSLLLGQLVVWHMPSSVSQQVLVRQENSLKGNEIKNSTYAGRGAKGAQSFGTPVEPLVKRTYAWYEVQCCLKSCLRGMARHAVLSGNCHIICLQAHGFSGFHGA